MSYLIYFSTGNFYPTKRYPLQNLPPYCKTAWRCNKTRRLLRRYMTLAHSSCLSVLYRPRGNCHKLLSVFEI